MAELDFLVKKPKLERSQDYAFLRREGLKHIEKLGSKLWTDYNVHDPGVTVLELLCYAITDLGYRTGYDIKDILTENEDGVPVNRSNFHTALEILPCNPVSFDDLRKLLIDIEGVRNAWIERHFGVKYCLDSVGRRLVDCPGTTTQVTENAPLNGLYDVYIEYDDFVDQTGTHEAVRDIVKARLHAHRNLCEDFVSICELEQEEIAVCADIEVIPSADVEEVLTEIFFRIGDHVSPVVRFYTFEELQDKGRTADQILTGPRLDHGFIDDEEFQKIKRRCEIRTSDILRIIMRVEGVAAVKEISLLSFVDGSDEPRIQADWLLTLATDRFRVPVFSSERSKFIFYKNDLPYFPNRDQVEARLREKKAADSHTKLRHDDKDLLPIPVGEFRDLENYYPMQNELPATYRVGRQRVAESASPLRKARARQLKAYLMFFEQLLANYLSQLAHVRVLFSWKKENASTYFTQAVTDIADIEELYNQKYLEDHAGSITAALEAIIEDRASAELRKSRFLEHLVARFSESFVDYSLLMYSLFGESARGRVNDDKRYFLEDYPELSSNRGRAYDYRKKSDVPDNISGYQHRVYRLLGIRKITRPNLAGERLLIVSVGAGKWRFELRDDASPSSPLFLSKTCDSRSAAEVLLDYALITGGDKNNYRLKGDGSGHALMRECPGDDEPRVIGTTHSPEVLDEVRSYFQTYADAEGFHLVEHILLRKRGPADPYLAIQLTDPEECDCVEVKDPYSFRMTVLLPSWPERFRDIKFRRFVEDTLQIEMPAHIFPKICWISHDQMRAFEERYDRWADKLADLTSGLGECTSVPSGGIVDEISPPLPDDGQAYAAALEELINILQGLVTVYPLARLHDCKQTQGDQPQASLNNMNLGTF